MKKIRKIMALVVAGALTISMASVAFAATAPTDTTAVGDYKASAGTKFTIKIPETKVTIDGTEKSINHKYAAYQIFTGDLNVTESDGTKTKTLSNVVWGSNVSLTATVSDKTLMQALAADTTLSGLGITATSTAAQVAKALDDQSFDSAAAQKFAAIVADYITGTAAAEDDSVLSGYYELTNLVAGYYLVQDETVASQTDYAQTRYMLEVVGNVTATPKQDVPEVKKSVDDKNDTTTAEDGVTWQDSADYDIGDTIPFKIVGTLADNYADYTTYKYSIVDTLTNLTYTTGSARVFASIYDTDEDTTTWYEVTDTFSASCPAKELTIQPTGNNLKNVTTGKLVTMATGKSLLTDVSSSNLSDTSVVASIADTNTTGLAFTKDTKIVVFYTATLDSGAVTATDAANANKNSVKITYSNNPNDGGEGTNDTTPDINIVFTYELDVDKIKGDDATSLTGAGFTLLKQYNASNFTEVEITAATAITDTTTYAADTLYSQTVNGTTTYWKLVSTTTGTSASAFTFKGLDDGTYRLIESTTPAGYNTMDPIDFTITATHEADDAAPAVQTLTVTGLAQGTATGTGNYVDGGTFTFAGDTSGSHSMVTGEGVIPTAIANYDGTQLPSTGGMGTTVLYIVGAIIIIGAGVLLVTRRKMAASK